MILFPVVNVNKKASLVDRPTQLICISDIYLLSWGGDLCGAVDFSICGSYSQQKQAR